MTRSWPRKALESAWQASVGPAGHAAGLGIDLVEVEPLRELIFAGGRAFLNTAWTIREQHDANAQPEGLAGKWAGKEAVMKALQHGIGEIDPRDVEILTTSLGAPRVELHGSALAIAKDRHVAGWHISVTHESGWAAAIAVASSHYRQVIDSPPNIPEGRSRG